MLASLLWEEPEGSAARLLELSVGHGCFCIRVEDKCGLARACSQPPVRHQIDHSRNKLMNKRYFCGLKKLLRGRKNPKADKGNASNGRIETTRSWLWLLHKE